MDYLDGILIKRIKQMKDSRPTWDEYFMNIAVETSKRSSCIRRQIGAVLVKDKRILATGYNGAPSKIKPCIHSECIRAKLNIPSGERHEICKAVHAEENAILQCAKYGISTIGGKIYVTTSPCSKCVKAILQVEISEVIYPKEINYPDQLSLNLIEESGIKITPLVYQL